MMVYQSRAELSPSVALLDSHSLELILPPAQIPKDNSLILVDSRVIVRKVKFIILLSLSFN